MILMHRCNLRLILSVVCLLIFTGCDGRGHAWPKTAEPQPTSTPRTPVVSRILLVSLDSPSWSPHGSKIVLVADQYGAGQSIVVTDSHLEDFDYLVGPPSRWDQIPTSTPQQIDGDDENLLTAMPTIVTVVVPATRGPDEYLHGLFFDPAWSPDGDTIAFYFYPQADSRNTLGMTDGIYTVDSQGENLKQVVALPYARTASGTDLSWSRDGKQLLYLRSDEQRRQWICIANSDGTGEQLVREVPEIKEAAWSPDGRRIAFIAASPDSWSALYVMASDGTGVSQITDSQAEGVLGMAWSPDSRRLVYSSVTSADYGNRLTIINADGSAPQVTNEAARYYRMAWSPAGDWLVLVTDARSAHGTVLVLKQVGS